VYVIFNEGVYLTKKKEVRRRKKDSDILFLFVLIDFDWWKKRRIRKLRKK